MTATPTLTVVMLAFGPEQHLGEAVGSVLASEGIDLELVLVDNGCTSTAVTDLAPDDRLVVLTPGTNLGFTGGVNLGARHGSGDFLALVNSDAVVERTTLQALVKHASVPEVGIAGATILLADRPDVVNSAGNPLHILGLSWAGDMGRPASELPGVRDVASASGACMVLRSAVWDDLGGFPEEYFAYVEDMELSWRCHQRGLRVQVLSDARALHHYEFSRSPLKMYLVERNRWLFLLTCHEKRTLWALAPPLAAFEMALVLVAIAQGWGGKKVRGWSWLLRHRAWISRRRRVVQSTRTATDAELLRYMTDVFDPAQTPLPPAARPLERVLQAYWRVARRFLRRER